MKIRRSTADALFSQYIRQRDKYCQRCRKYADSLQCAHIYSRRHWATRHDPENAIALCFSCHQYFTENPLVFAEWCQLKYGKAKMRSLDVRAHSVVKRSRGDEKLRAAALRKLLAGLAA